MALCLRLGLVLTGGFAWRLFVPMRYAGLRCLQRRVTFFGGGANGAQVGTSASFEILAAGLALAGSRTEPVMMGHYGYRRQQAKADCSELVTRELLNALLWNEHAGAFETTKLPVGVSPALAAFFAEGGPADQQQHVGWRPAEPVNDAVASEVFFEICQNLPNTQYHSGIIGQR